jgi:hypothetical protein
MSEPGGAHAPEAAGPWNAEGLLVAPLTRSTGWSAARWGRGPGRNQPIPGAPHIPPA